MPDEATARRVQRAKAQHVNGGAMVPLEETTVDEVRTGILASGAREASHDSGRTENPEKLATPTAPLFNRDGQLLGYRTQANLINRVLDAARLGGEGVRFHIFRHTYARRFIELGGRFEELQKSLGHKSIRTTEGTYAHFPEDVAAAQARARIYGEGLKVVR